MSIAITGANGFIGSYLTQRLKAEKKPYVVIPHKMSLHEIVDAFGGVECVVHLASVFIAEHKPEDIELLVQSNVGFGTRVLEACRIAGVKRVVVTGSSWQHSGNASVNLYGALKTGLEEVAKYYSDAHEISIPFLKLYDSFGKGDTRPKLVPFLLDAYKNREKKAPLLLSAGEQIVDFIHVDNSIEAILKALEWAGVNPGVFHAFRVSGRDPMTLKSFVGLIEETIDHKFDIQWGVRPYRTREVMIPWAEAEEVPGYAPLLSLREGLHKVFTSSP